MSIRARLPALLLLAGAAALAVTVPVVLSLGPAAKELPWVLGTGAFLVAGTLVWRRLPQHPLAWWFAVAGGLVAIVQAFDGLLLRATTGGPSEGLAWLVLASQTTMAVGLIAIVHLLGLFPDGQAQRPYERRVLRALWVLVACPPLVLVGRPFLLLPSYHQMPDLANPYYVPALAPVGRLAGVGIELLQGLIFVGVVLLGLRYRRAADDARRRIRWLFLPALFTAFVGAADLVAWATFPDGAPNATAEFALTFLWIPAIISLPVALAVAMLRPKVMDVDRVIRHSLVYGFLWLVIAGAYVGAASALGLAAGRRFPLGLAIALTVAATLVFHPARRRLEVLADRWVFGPRADPAQLVSRLGDTLAATFDLDELLPRMAETLQEGLALRWARVRLDPAETAAGEGEPAVLAVPIILGEELVGVVECGPKLSGPFTADDEMVVTTFAHQAALAVHNLRLTTELAAHAAELARSRTRLVRAQEAERRRIERNIHDGVQQDLVALIGHTAHVRSQLHRDPGAGEAALDELQAGLRRVLADLRELAHGIHPSVLTDRGLLEAVENLAARSTVPVSVRADPSLRGARFAEEIEGAGYFTVAEALANMLKHASAHHAEITLARSNGSLQIAVHDDGTGFDQASGAGRGLSNLAERVAALGGRLEVTSGAGAGTTVSALLHARPADG
jgi:signal transduction histidine kinase